MYFIIKEQNDEECDTSTNAQHRLHDDAMKNYSRANPCTICQNNNFLLTEVNIRRIFSPPFFFVDFFNWGDYLI